MAVTSTMAIDQRQVVTAFQDSMGIGSTVAERVHTGTPRNVIDSRPILLSGRHFQLPLLEMDLGIWFLEQHVGWDFALLNCQSCFDNTS
jgi:hypothetical protein